MGIALELERIMRSFLLLKKSVFSNALIALLMYVLLTSMTLPINPSQKVATNFRFPVCSSDKTCGTVAIKHLPYGYSYSYLNKYTSITVNIVCLTGIWR